MKKQTCYLLDPPIPPVHASPPPSATPKREEILKSSLVIYGQYHLSFCDTIREFSRAKTLNSPCRAYKHFAYHASCTTDVFTEQANITNTLTTGSEGE